MDSSQQREVRYPRNASPALDGPWNDFPASQYLQSAPSSYSHPVPRQHAGVEWIGDAGLPPANAIGSHWQDEDAGDMPPPVQTTAQGRPQDLQYLNTGYYNMINDHPPINDHRDHVINVSLDVPAQVTPSAPEIDIFGGPLRNAAADPTRVFPVEWPPLDRVPDGRANEVLRELAILYLREPNSQVAVIRMEPGHDAHGVRVVIALDLAAGL